MMKVLFYTADQHPARDRTRGITSYTDGLIRVLARESAVRAACLASRSSWRSSVDSVEKIVLPFRTDHALGRLVGDHGHALLDRPKRFDLWHYPKGFLPVARRVECPTVGTVHDLIVVHYAERYPESRSRFAFWYWLSVLRRSLRQMDLLVTVSAASRAAIEAFCRREGLPCPPIVVTYEGARWEGDDPSHAGKSGYVLHLGSPHPHKRTDTLLEFWNVLGERMADLPELRVVGSLTDKQVRRVSRTPGVSHEPWIPDEQLKARIASALALIVCSEVEGFGLPALEAYYLGTPTVYVRNTAVEEVLGAGTPGGFDLESVEDFQRALEEALNLDADIVRATSERLRSRFSWAQCARRTCAAYETLL